jgi:prepilin-type N-terminal cleavage/methylation domain-containing protein/prepilin-type processing-associated H-X9-DG protein
MSKRSGPGFTLVELLVVIAIIALLMGVLMPALSRAREQGKRVVCLHNQRQLAVAWNIYADDNGDKIMNGDAEETGDWQPPSGEYSCTPHRGIHCNEQPWILQDWAAGLSIEEQKTQLMGGVMFRYLKDIKTFRCPRADASELRSFSVVDQMNVEILSAAVLNTNVPLTKIRQQLKKTYERMIFVDDGGPQGRHSMGGWTVSFQLPPRWWDLPSARHGDGTTFSFADGHAEYHKWSESSTLECAKQVAENECYINPVTATKDIRWAQIAAWGTETATALTKTWP